MLDRGTERPLTVISAGAGWGKTLATASWAAAEPAVGPVAWISLDPSDNEPRAFWTFFVRAVRHAVVVPADNPLAELAPGLGNESAGLQRLVAGLEQLPTPVVVVLDDFHLIDDASVLEGVASLLRRPLEQLRLVIVTRSDPPIPLHRLRTADELSEIRTRDLAFDETDAVAMLAADELDVELDDVQLLVRRTEGWPAGMRLAALFLGRRDQDRSPASFAGDDQAVTDYLVGEVLSSQPPEVQRFLLQTSVAERVSSGLAEALTGEPRAQHHLESLERSNAFVVGLGPGREWFRYHALLREVLQHRLRVDDPAAPADLHRRAAVWFAAHARPLDAMRHAADAEDWSLLGDLFVTHALALTVSADRAAVDRVLARIPRERLADSPALALCAAARLMHAGRFEEMAPHLELAAALIDRTVRRSPPSPGCFSRRPTCGARATSAVRATPPRARSSTSPVSSPPCRVPTCTCRWRSTTWAARSCGKRVRPRRHSAFSKPWPSSTAPGWTRPGSTPSRTSPWSMQARVVCVRAPATPRRRSSWSRRAAGSRFRRRRRPTWRSR